MPHPAANALTYERYRALVADFGPPGMAWHALGSVPDERIGFAVHLAGWRGRPILVRHEGREVWELPGGRREPGEAVLDTARRELVEECGAFEARIQALCLYSVRLPGSETFGLLCRSAVERFAGPIPEFEIAEARAVERLDLPLAYPEIQGLILAACASLFPRLAPPDGAFLSSLPDTAIDGTSPSGLPFEP